MTTSSLPLRVARRLPRPVTVLGWGAFKIGRNEGIKYPTAYDLPSDAESERLVHAVVDMGIGVIDTAPAYGLSEARLGAALAGRRDRVFLSTKVGETFADGRSTFDFSRTAADAGIRRSLERLRTDHVDIAWVHSNGEDLPILRDGGCVSGLETARNEGRIRGVGFSPKTLEGAMACVTHGAFDAIMLEIHPEDGTMLHAAEAAATAGMGVFVKKPLASGRLSPERAIPWILSHTAVTSVVIGGLHAGRLRATVELAASIPRPSSA